MLQLSLSVQPSSDSASTILHVRGVGYHDPRQFSKPVVQRLQFLIDNVAMTSSSIILSIYLLKPSTVPSFSWVLISRYANHRQCKKLFIFVVYTHMVEPAACRLRIIIFIFWWDFEPMSSGLKVAMLPLCYTLLSTFNLL